jgi:hypothetical protein
MNGSRKPVVKFLAIFAALYVICVLPWPGWQDTTASAFQAFGNLFVGNSRGEGTVVFGPMPAGSGSFDTKITLYNSTRTRYRDFIYSSRIYAYLPISLLVCLCLATPLPWRSRLKLTGSGLAILAVFLALRILLLLLRELTRYDAVSIWRPSRSVWWCIDVVSGIAVQAPVPNFAFPILIWAFLAIWLGNFRPLIGRKRG